VCSEHGAPEGIEIRDIPSPTVGPGQARIRVDTAAVNFPDVLLIADKYQLSVPTPFVPGSEFVGDVIEVATDVDSVAVGDRVFGSTMVGAFAEEVVVGVHALTHVPDGVDARHAAAFGVAHRTAYHALRSFARVQPGEELIVLGAGGGVGLAAVQLGVALGAVVTAVTSTASKIEAVKGKGASRVVDDSAGDLRQALKDALPGGADAVIDPVGGTLSEAALRSLRWRGRLVSIGYASGDIPKIPLNVVLLKGAQIHGFQLRDFATNEPDDFARNEREVLELLTSGRAVPHIGATFALDETAAALRFMADARAVGKIIIDVAG
jgi:NADPH2:quinone reductase